MKKINKILDNKYLLIFTTFIISSLMTFPSLFPTYSLDGYCSACSSYQNYALIFVNAGRYITAFFYYLIGVFNVPINFISIISVILSNIFLSISVYLIYRQISKFIKCDILAKLLIYLGAFLICFNPFVCEFYVFEESFALSAAFLITIYSVNILFSEKKLKFLKSFIALFIVSMLYQGILCIYIPYAFLLIIIQTKDKNILYNIKNNYKFYIKGMVCYCLALIISYLLLKINLKIFNLNSAKFGELNVMYNIFNVFRLTKNTFHSFFNLLDPKLFYFSFLFIFIIIGCFTLLDFKKNLSYLLYSIILVALCIVFAFVPNLAMNSLDNYTAARMTSSIGAIKCFLILISFIFITNNNKVLKKYYMLLLLSVSLIFFIFVCYNYLRNSYYGLKRYNNDSNYANEISEVINIYEKETKREVKKIYYYKEPSVNYYYDGINNGYNIRFYAVDWGFECGINYFLTKNYSVEKMSLEKYNSYKELELKEYNGFKYMFDKDSMYLILLY